MSEAARDATRAASRGRGVQQRRGRQAKDPDRIAFGPNGFVITREYELFVEFLDSVRRYRWLAVCTGESGVGKTCYAERYAAWDVIKPAYPRYAYSGQLPREVAHCRTVYYKAPVAVTPKQLMGEITDRRRVVSQLVDRAARAHGVGAPEGPMGLEDRTELLIVDEAQRVKGNALEQLRDLYDEGGFGVVMMSAQPRFDKVLRTDERYETRLPSPYRIRAPRAAPTRAIVEHPAVLNVDLPPEAFSDEDAVSAIVQITRGNFGRLKLLVQQIEDKLRANKIGNGPESVTLQVVETAAASTYAPG